MQAPLLSKSLYEIEQLREKPDVGSARYVRQVWGLWDIKMRRAGAQGNRLNRLCNEKSDEMVVAPSGGLEIGLDR